MMQNLKIDNMSEAFDKMIERMFDSKADIVIFTMQDMMKEGGEYRINTPGTATGNWHYRLDKNYCNDTLANWMNKMTKKALR